jgi:hypothetical protein
MGSRHPIQSKPSTVDELSDLLLRASPTLEAPQLLELADLLHDVIRDRRTSVFRRDERSYRPYERGE